MSIDLSLRRSFFAKYEGRSIEDVVDDVDHPRSSSLQKVNACIWSFSSAEESGERCSNTFQHQLRNILLVYKIYFFFFFVSCKLQNGMNFLDRPHHDVHPFYENTQLSSIDSTPL